MAMGLPDPFLCPDGRRVDAPAAWRERRADLLDLILDLEYGGMPPAPAQTAGELLHRHAMARFGGAGHAQYRLSCRLERPFSFLLDLYTPPQGGPFPVILSGDGCWREPGDELTALILGRGYALAQFNRVEIVPDLPCPARDRGLYAVCAPSDFGALSAWAWGYHRCVDLLAGLPEVDAARITATGHSRGGKAALLAGATDGRLALTSPNASGCGGAASYRHYGPGSERLADILGRFPYWFGPKLAAFVGREAELPFDQHCLKALVAPRALFCTESLDDLWANPGGARQTQLAAREVYAYLGAVESLGQHYRRGGHEQGPEDWRALLDFADWRFFGKGDGQGFRDDPFPAEPVAFAWRFPRQD